MTREEKRFLINNKELVIRFWFNLFQLKLSDILLIIFSGNDFRHTPNWTVVLTLQFHYWKANTHFHRERPIGSYIRIHNVNSRLTNPQTWKCFQVILQQSHYFYHYFFGSFETIFFFYFLPLLFSRLILPLLTTVSFLFSFYNN